MFTIVLHITIGSLRAAVALLYSLGKLAGIDRRRCADLVVGAVDSPVGGQERSAGAFTALEVVATRRHPGRPRSTQRHDHGSSIRGPVLDGQDSDDAVVAGCPAQLLIFNFQDVYDPHQLLDVMNDRR
ncbi:hypothetical protein ABZ614_08065 [Streptomyces sp. NPDC013178]|uniref:hypothetical protein n=1 Tax=Streptomyces sp. NPDC013178 TaxID=3155118 RepID=UPI0033EF2D97